MPSVITILKPKTLDEQVDWPSLGDPNVWSDIEYKPEPAADTGEGSIAERVLTQYEIPYVTGGDYVGGKLLGYDIHNMDATNAIKLSLLENLEDQVFIELYANEAGEGEFIEIGEGDFGGEARYSIPTRKVINKTDQVKITGFNPPAMVYVRGPFDILVGDDGGDPEIVDDIANIMNSTCYDELFARYATIMYRTPILKSDWGDTLDSLYEPASFESILGWIHHIDIADENLSSAADVIFSDTTPYPHSLTLDEWENATIRYNIDPATQTEVNCYIPSDINFNDEGIEITIPNSTYVDVDTEQVLSDVFEVRQAFIMGYEVYDSYTIEDGAEKTLGVYCMNVRIPFSLNEGNDYKWGFNDEGDIKIVFGVGQTEADEYLEGRGFDITSPTKVIGGPNYGEENSEGGPGDYRMWPHLNASRSGGAGKGMGTSHLFNELWVDVGRKKSSITIFDPAGNADEALRGSSYNMYAIISCDPPAPVAGAGTFEGCVDFSDCTFDANPMTVQDLTTCDSAELADAMTGASIDLTLPFIDDINIIINDNETQITYCEKNRLQKIAQFILDLTDEGEVDEATYILGPTEQPKLGDKYGTGVINSISYSYQDSSSYLISVGTGPKYLKDTVSANDASIWQINVETVTKEGFVTQVAGNGIHYVVHVDGMGDYIAVNTISNQLPPEVGDRVTIEMNNVPVGWQ